MKIKMAVFISICLGVLYVPFAHSQESKGSDSALAPEHQTQKEDRVSLITQALDQVEKPQSNSMQKEDKPIPVDSLAVDSQKDEKLQAKELHRQEEGLYQRAMLLFRQGKYLEAREVFTELEGLTLDYKDSNSIVRLIDRRLDVD